MEISDYYLQLKGKTLIERPLVPEKDYKLHAVVSVRSIRQTPNEDGTMDETFLVEPLSAEIESEQGQRMTLKSRGKKSQALRLKIIAWMRDEWEGEDVEDDELYSIFMGKLLNNFEHLATLIIKSNGD